MHERDVCAQAQLLVDAFVMQHKAAAIPSLIGACVAWAVHNGAPIQMKKTLSNAITLTDNAHEACKKTRQ